LTYTPAGKESLQIWARKNARGKFLAQRKIYDNKTGQLKGIDYNDGTPSVRYKYDHAGRVAAILDVVGLRRFEYDDDPGADGITSMTERINPPGAADLIKRIQWPHQPLYTATITRTYKQLIISPLSSGGEGQGESSHKAEGPPNSSPGRQLIAVTLDEDYRIAYGYDDQQRLSTIRAKLPGADREHEFRYDRDPITGAITSLTEPTSGYVTRHTYDPQTLRLVGLETMMKNVGVDKTFATQRYVYDQLGNPTQQYCSGEIFARSYVNVYTYDAANRLVKERRYFGDDPQNASNVDPNHDIEFMYDLLGNRLEQKTPTMTTTYTVNNLNQVLTANRSAERVNNFETATCRN
jgi:hypothetical protein